MCDQRTLCYFSVGTSLLYEYLSVGSCVFMDLKIIRFSILFYDSFLEYGKNESFIRSQDYLTVIGFCANNPTANPIVWDFVR